MCHLSPTVHLAWATLACGLQIFLIQHLWRYDRFKCLTWFSGRQPGAFKRVMTYSYCTSVPALLVYSVTMAILKYRNGYFEIPGHGIVPTPYQLWPEEDRAWLTPLYILFGVTWGLELVTHLEELTFWLFLLHQGPTRRDWFSSIEFKAWAASSFVALTGMPLTAILTRSDPLKTEAYTFLVGGAASTCVTTVFFIVLIKFPAFLRRVKREGAAGPVVLRLVKFHELNVLRVIFRLFFTLPLIVLGVDGVLTHHVINESLLWTDFLAFLAAVGTVVSSTLTLLIFFPRSLAEDSNWRPRTTDSHASFVSGTSRVGPFRPLNVKASFATDPGSGGGSPYSPGREVEPTSSYPMAAMSKPKYYSDHAAPNPLTTPYYPPTPYGASAVSMEQSPVHYELREMEDGYADDRSAKTWGGSDSEGLIRGVERTAQARYGEDGAKRSPLNDAQLNVRLVELGHAVAAGLKPPRPPRPPRLHPYIMSFTSPIDLMSAGDDGPRAI